MMNQSRTGKAFLRLLILISIFAAYRYLLWRYTGSINFGALWLSIPFIIAETYGIIDMTLFFFTMWKPVKRIPPPAVADSSVDVFITTYNEPCDLLETTVSAALAIDWQKKNVYILDDGDREEIRNLASRLGCGYITRGPEWVGKPRHAKAGNVNNALLQTDGEYILIFDADQIPAPTILDRTLGYFQDSSVAFVQTPQVFYNIPPGDPFGNDASLFYGPIMEGKDGWNAAFFCGSNAVLRRDALMQLGVATYVRTVESKMRAGLLRLKKDINKLKVKGDKRIQAKKALLTRIRESLKKLQENESLSVVRAEVLLAIREANEILTNEDLQDIAGILDQLASDGDVSANMAFATIKQDQADISKYLFAPESIGISNEALSDIDLTRSDEALPVQALNTKSITEDMATALRLHAMGFRSVYHNEVLAKGLAPDDLNTSMKQRLRWAKGTIQVLLKENPLSLPGLTLPQRLMYFTTIFSYFSGFFYFMLLVAPVIWFFTAIAPVAAWDRQFFLHLVPFLILNRLTYIIITKGHTLLRSEQYSIGLFPLWIKAVMSALFQKTHKFEVTPKFRQDGTHVRLVIPQLAIIVFTLGGILFAGIVIAYGGGRYTLLGYMVNTFWGIHNCFMLSAVVKASVYRPSSCLAQSDST